MSINVKKQRFFDPFLGLQKWSFLALKSVLCNNSNDNINIYDVYNDVIIVSIAINNVVDMLLEPKKA